MDWTNRYQHHLTLTIRVWPRNGNTLEASLKNTLFKVDGMQFTSNELMAVTSRYGKAQSCYYCWEMSKEDSDRLLSVGTAGARIDEMRVKTPGTLIDTVKKEYWLEVDVTVYPISMERKHPDKGIILHGKEEDICKAAMRLWEKDHDENRRWVKRYYGYAVLKYRPWLEAWNEKRRKFTGVHYIVNRELIDIDLMARKIMEGKVILIDWRLHQNNKVQMKKIHDALEYWVEPGKAPDEPGGEFMGYCLSRSVFWCDQMDIPADVLALGEEKLIEYRAEEKLERRRRNVEKFFIEAVANRVAKFYGVSRERVMRRFIEEGFVDYLAEEASRVSHDKERMKIPSYEAICKGPAAEVAKVMGFCVDSMAIRPPDPTPPILSPKQQEARMEYQRQKIDAFNKLPKEEQEKIIAKREHRLRGRPERLLQRIIAQIAIEDNRFGETDLITAELTAAGVTDLVLNAIRTRRDRCVAGFCDEQQEAIIRLGVKAVRVLLKCKTAEAVESWQNPEV